MLTHFFKIAFRNIRKYKGYTFINVAGLAISLACCMLIALWLLNEMSYDSHYSDSDRIMAILLNEDTSTPNALGPYLQQQVPEIMHAARTTHGGEVLVRSGSRNAYERVMAADPAIIQIFSFPFLAGDPATALAEPNSIVITRTAAAKYFPEEDAMGKTVSLSNRDLYTVTGVIEDIPFNSSLRFDFLASMDYQRKPWVNAGYEYDSWGFWSTRTYAKVHSGITSSALSRKITDLIREHQDAPLSAIEIGDLHLRFSESRRTIPVFSAIALAILAMACINFINLSTARYRMRAKETAMRKIIGAHRGTLIAQFLGESAFLMFLGVVIALGLLETVLPAFNSVFQVRLSLSLFYNTPVLLISGAIAALVAVLAGIYPALVLSRFHPIQALKDKLDRTGRQLNPRRVLVVFQFAVTAMLIVGIAVIYAQLDYIKSWDVGYDKEHVVNIRMRGDSGKQFGALKNELVKNPAIVSVAGGGATLPYWHMSTTASWDDLNPDETRDVSFNFISYDFLKTFGIELVEGRDFGEGFGSDEQGCLINESLARMMNQDVAIGSRITILSEDRQVTGVMKDFNFRPLDARIEPLAMLIIPAEESMFAGINILSVRIGPENVQSSINCIRETWNRVIPDYPFEYTFLDQAFDANYRSLEQVNNLAVCFGLLAVFIAALGLFGLASFTAEQRTKEIGIRKVLGATLLNIVRMMSKEYVILVAIANIVAWPVAWYIMNDWLNGFAYHIEISISTFILVAGFTLVVALLSVGYQAIRAANTNPVDAIQYE